MVRSSSSRLSFWKILSIGPSAIALLFAAYAPIELSNGNLVVPFLKNGRGSSFLVFLDFAATFAIPLVNSLSISFLFCKGTTLQVSIPQPGKANEWPFTQ